MLDLYRKFIEEESAQADSVKELGSVLQRDRIEHMAEMCCLRGPGDLIEIGCYVGGTSSRLAMIARKYQRKLVCVDNWKGGDSYHLDQMGEMFTRDMQSFLDVLIVLKGDAHEQSIIDQIKLRQYCFAFSDDGHEYEYHLSELNTLMPIVSDLIMVDDIYLPDVRRAIADSIQAHAGWNEHTDTRLRESWLIKNGGRPVQAAATEQKTQPVPVAAKREEKYQPNKNRKGR